MAKITIISVTYGHTKAQIDAHIANWINQSFQDWELWVVHDGPSEAVKNWVSSWEDSRVLYKCSETRLGSFGHPNRRDFCNLIETSLVHITNADNTYSPKFLEIMIQVLEDKQLGMVLCWCAHNYGCQQPENNEPMVPYSILKPTPNLNRVDWCTVITHTELIKKNGFNHINFAGQDGMLFQEIVQSYNTPWATYPGVLVTHN